MDNKNKNIGLYILIAILFILLLIFGGYFIYKTQTNESSSSSNTNAKDSNTNSNTLISKIDNTKDWIYDADYTKNVNADSYSTNYNTYYSKDIVVPFININSTYANNSNTEIKSIFNEVIAAYNKGVNDKMTYVDECNYKKYINNNNISLLLTYGIGATDVVKPKYFTYNIDLKTGNKLSYEEVYTIAGYNSNSINSKVEASITKAMHEKLSNNPVDFDTYNNTSINNYKTSVSNNSLKYFLSENNKLNIVVTLSIPAGAGEFDTIITID